jgi:hypothetical protein
MSDRADDATSSGRRDLPDMRPSFTREPSHQANPEGSPALPAPNEASSTEVRMSISVSLDGITTNARDRLQACVQRFADDLARETARLEEGDREGDAHVPEVTTSNVIRANQWIRNPSRTSYRVPSGFDIAIQILGFVSTFRCGRHGKLLYP